MDLKIAFCVILLVRDVKLDKTLVSESMVQMRCDTCRHNPETCCVGIFMHPTYIITTSYCAKSCGKITWKRKEVFVRKTYILSKNFYKYHQQNTVMMNNDIAILKVRETKQLGSFRVWKLSSVDTSLVTGSVAFVPIQRKKYLIRRKVYIGQCPNDVFKESFVCVESKYYRDPQRCLRTQGLPLLLDNRIIGITATIGENICYTQVPKVFLATRAAIKMIYNIIIKSNRTKDNTYCAIKRRTDVGLGIVTAITAKHTVLTASDNTTPPQYIHLQQIVTTRALSLLMPKLTSTTPMSSSVLRQNPLYLDTLPASPRFSYVPTSQSTTSLPIRVLHLETAITAKKKTPSVIIITAPKVDFSRNIASNNINALRAKHNGITHEMNTSSTLPLKINALRLQGKLNVTNATEVLELNINNNATNFKVGSMVQINNMEQLAQTPSINGHQSSGITSRAEGRSFLVLENTTVNPTKKKSFEQSRKPSAILLIMHGTEGYVISKSTNQTMHEKKNLKSRTSDSLESIQSSSVSSNCTEATFTSSLMSTINKKFSPSIIAWQNISTHALPLSANTEKANNDPFNKSTNFKEKENGNLNRVHKALARFKAAMKTNKKVRNFVVQKTVTTVGPPTEFMDLT